MKNCSYGVNKEVFLTDFRSHCFLHGAIFMLVVKDMEGIGRLLVVIFYVEKVLIINILTVASCWFYLLLHDLLTMHGHRNRNLKI